jgi:AcrR family transcriptional regulator
MGTKERRLRERQMRAEQIQAAAERVFLKRGYEDATIQRIAKEAELSIGTIYFYFKTKEEIYASLNLKFIQTCDRGLQDILGRDDLTVEGKLAQIWDLLNNVFCQSPLGLRALVHGQLQGSLQNISEPLLKALNQTGKSLLNQIASLFQDGMDQGAVRPANPMALADLLWSTFTGVVAWQEAKQTSDSSKQFRGSMLELAFETFLRGIRPDEKARS